MGKTYQKKRGATRSGEQVVPAGGGSWGQKTNDRASLREVDDQGHGKAEDYSESSTEVRGRLLDFIVELTAARILLGVILLIALGVTLTYISFAVTPPGKAESFGSFLLRGVGMGLLVTAVTSALLQALIVRSRERLQSLLNKFMHDDVMSELANIRQELARVISGRRKFGLVRFHATTQNGRFDFSVVFSRLKQGDELLWLDTYVATYREFETAFREALMKKVRVRMLIIKPECQNARLRAEEIDRTGFGPLTFSKEVEEFREWVGEVARSAANQEPAVRDLCKIRSYDDLPCMPMYLIRRGEELIAGYTSVFLSQPSAYFSHLEWQDTPDGLLRPMCQYFEQKWDRHQADELRLFGLPELR